MTSGGGYGDGDDDDGGIGGSVARPPEMRTKRATRPLMTSPMSSTKPMRPLRCAPSRRLTSPLVVVVAYLRSLHIGHLCGCCSAGLVNMRRVSSVGSFLLLILEKKFKLDCY